MPPQFTSVLPYWLLTPISKIYFEFNFRISAPIGVPLNSLRLGFGLILVIAAALYWASTRAPEETSQPSDLVRLPTQDSSWEKQPSREAQRLEEGLQDPSKRVAVEKTLEAGLEERSSMAGSGAYDHSVYLADPEAYVKRVVPGRIHHTAMGAEGVPSLMPLSQTDRQVAALGTLEFKVKAMPQVPVTFQTHGLGAFSNQRTTQTVSSDAEGIATVTWTAIRGTVGDVVVVAACPLAVGQVRFLGHIQ